MQSLPLFHVIAGKPVIVLGAGDAADARHRLVERAGGVVCADADDGIAQGARLAFIALDDDDAMAEAEATRLRAAGLLVNVTDRPALCDFTMPSLLDRDPVLVAIGTGGASAGLAKALRLRLERLLPQRLGELAEQLYAARADLRARWPDGGSRRRALDDALADGGPLDPLASDSAARVDCWLANADQPPVSGQHAETLASDDPDDLTLRQARLLGMADVVLHDPDIAPAILDRARADAVRLVLPHAGPVPVGLVIILKRA